MRATHRVGAMAVACLAGATLLIAARAGADRGLADAVRAAFDEALQGPLADDARVGDAALVGCPGDCNGDGSVAIDELIRAVAIALGQTPVSACSGLDTNADGAIEVAEIVSAVGGALNGCSGALESVCGGPITSAPKLCDLMLSPRVVSASGTLTITLSLSDREGDFAQICAAIAPQSAQPPELSCNPLSAQGATVNQVLQLAPIQLNGAASGAYVLYLQLVDATGQRSAVVSATFSVGRKA